MALTWRANSLHQCGLLQFDSKADDNVEALRNGSIGIDSLLSMHIYGLRKRHDNLDFSEWGRDHKLEELRRAHLNNVVQLQQMSIGTWREDRNGRLRKDGHGASFRRLQRINSEEELDFHETSSGSDQSETSSEDNVRDMTPVVTKTREKTVDREPSQSPEEMRKILKNFRTRPESRGFGGRRGASKVTVPKPFQMTLREARKVRTRSEVEMENALLRRELDELRECQKNFRASPAPAHVRMPLCDIPGSRLCAVPRNIHLPERERKKRVDKTAARPVCLTGTAVQQLTGSHRRKSDTFKPVKKQLEVSIELVKSEPCE